MLLLASSRVTLTFSSVTVVLDDYISQCRPLVIILVLTPSVCCEVGLARASRGRRAVTATSCLPSSSFRACPDKLHDTLCCIQSHLAFYACAVEAVSCSALPQDLPIDTRSSVLLWRWKRTGERWALMVWLLWRVFTLTRQKWARFVCACRDSTYKLLPPPLLRTSSHLTPSRL